MISHLGRDRRGTAALEFALTLPVLLALMGGLADFGLLWRTRGEVAAAVNAGASYAILAGNAATQTNVQAAMTAGSTLTGVTYSATPPSLSCVSTSGGSTALVPPPQTGSCPDGTAPVNYIQLTGTYTYTPIMPGFSHITATSRSERATVRLQ